MHLVATKPKYGKKLQVLYFDPAPTPGACDVIEVWGTHRRTYIPKCGYCIITQTLNINVWKLDGMTDRQMDAQTNGWTDNMTEERRDY